MGEIMIGDECYYCSSIEKQEKFIKKRRIAARMISKLLIENHDLEVDYIDLETELKTIHNINEKLRLQNYNLRCEIKKLEIEKEQDKKIYNEFLQEKFRTDGEIKALKWVIETQKKN